MIIVKVTYTVKPDFVIKNQESINAFLKDFKKIKSNDFRYIANWAKTKKRSLIFHCIKTKPYKSNF